MTAGGAASMTLAPVGAGTPLTGFIVGFRVEQSK